MDVATTVRVQVGVRELKNHLSRYLAQVADGTQVIVTEHGRPIAQLTSIDSSTTALSDLVGAGLVRPPTALSRSRPTPVASTGSVSEFVADQRR
jgi:prevent-host-death family protein